MPKLIESRFRALEFDSNDVFLTDIADTGMPVYVNRQLDEYDDSLQSKIDELEVGNVIEAEIQSESVSQQDDFWKFISLTITDRTIFHFIEDADNHLSSVDKLTKQSKNTNKDSIRIRIKSNEETIGYITVGEDQGDSFWNGLKGGYNSHELDIKNLHEINDSPHEVIYTRNTAEDRLVFYHFSEKNTEAAKAIISANISESQDIDKA